MKLKEWNIKDLLWRKLIDSIAILKNVRKVNVTLRQEKGSDIDGACGQLRQRNKKG